MLLLQHTTNITPMNNRLLAGCLAFILLLAVNTALLHAQDSLKKSKPPVKTAPVKPVYKPSPYAAKNYPVAGKPGITAATSFKTLITTADPSQLNDKSLNGQYQYLLSKTYHYQQPLISALWKNVMDTLSVTRRQLKEAQSKLTAQNQTVSSLKADVNNKDQSLTESNQKVDSISVFGLLLPKATYNLVMFGLVAGLAVALFIVIAATAKYKHEAKYRIGLYDELDEEYKTFKLKANDKEKKLARELQTERNKVDELLGRG